MGQSRASNDRDSRGRTPLLVAACIIKSLPLVVWLLDEEGADVNVRCYREITALYGVRSLAVLTALLVRGADPSLLADNGTTILMSQTSYGSVESVTCLLEDSRARSTANLQCDGGHTALHYACSNEGPSVHLLLHAAASPAIINNRGETPLALLRNKYPTPHATIALFEQVPDAEKASLLVKARRIAVATISNVIAPSCMEGRVARGQPLPDLLLRWVVLRPVTGSRNEVKEEGRTLRTMVEFLLGVGGPSGQGMPRDVFRVVMDLLMPSWDPLRRKSTGTGEQLQG